MSSIGTGYDLSASQFSPDGRVFQVEYAHKAVENSGTVIGLRGKDGVVFAVEKLVTSKLYEPGANRRIFNIDRNIGMAVSGLISDARQIVETARTEASNYRAQYGYGIPLKYLNDRVSMYMHAYTLYSAVRPFGCSVIIGTYEEDGPTMFMIDPSGVSYGYYGCAMGKAKKKATYEIEKLNMPHITVARNVPKHVHDVEVNVSVVLQGYYGCAVGKAKQAAKTEIEKLKLADMSLKDMVKEAARIIYLVHDELKDKQFELELSWVGAQTNGLFSRVPDSVFHEAEKFAKTAMEDDSDSDTEDM